MLDSLTISKSQLRKITAFLTRCVPEEGCGLLAGSPDGIVHTIFTITNKFHSPTRFRMDEMELIHAFRDMDSNQQVLLGIFHSHPTGPDHPSMTDLAEFYYPDSFMVIFSRLKRGWDVNAYQIDPVTKFYISIHFNRI
jgi:proteasome lid subunit RPN8/RPN11